MRFSRVGHGQLFMTESTGETVWKKCATTFACDASDPTDSLTQEFPAHVECTVVQDADGSQVKAEEVVEDEGPEEVPDVEEEVVDETEKVATEEVDETPVSTEDTPITVEG